MKFVSNFLRVLAALLAVATVAAFFFPFVNVAVTGAQASMNGLECAFGADLTEELGSGMTTYKGGWFLILAILVVLTAVCWIASLFSKKKGLGGAAVVTGLLSSILLIVLIASPEGTYVDMGHVAGATLTYALGMMLAVIGGIATFVMCIVAILAKDAVECKETGDLTIPRKVLKFFREYKSELKKVVWPGPRSVVKNTLVVLGVCAFVLLLIWLVDMGLGELFKLCFGK